jgi:hypothetical protein
MSGPDDRSPFESELLRQRIRLYLYGELALAERQEIERFREEDPRFRSLFAEEQAFLLALGRNDIDVDSLLLECREDLILAVAAEARPSRPVTLVKRFRQRIGHIGAELAARPLAWQPIAAALLLAAGFFAGRGFEPRWYLPPGSDPGQPVSFDAGRTLTGIETVRLDPVGGKVQIVVEERRVVTGASSDPVIRGILLDTVHESHAGARLSSLDALRAYASDADVRRTLLRSMLEDENPGVRLKALDAVRDQIGHPEVRDALVQTLRRDPVEGMRVHAIQLLGEQPARDLAGALQELLESEPNPFVLHESERILDSLGASMERF